MRGLIDLLFGLICLISVSVAGAAEYTDPDGFLLARADGAFAETASNIRVTDGLPVGFLDDLSAPLRMGIIYGLLGGIIGGLIGAIKYLFTQTVSEGL